MAGGEEHRPIFERWGEGRNESCLSRRRQRGEEVCFHRIYYKTRLIISFRGQVLTSFNGPVSNLKVSRLDSNTTALALTGLATPAGELYNPETAEKPLSSGKVYSKLFVRQWDAYKTENTSAIWYTTLTKSEEVNGMTVAPLRNALSGHKIKLESPVPPFGGAGDFDISKNGIVFVAKDPKLDPAN